MAKKKPETAEARTYSRQLRNVARMISAILKAYTESDPDKTLRMTPELQKQLDDYGDTLGPWARRVAANMIVGLERRADRERRVLMTAQQRFMKRSEEISSGLSEEFQGKIGQEVERLINEQVDLITALPRRTAAKVQKLAQEAHVKGYRDEWLVKKILELSDISVAQATTIARTEISRSQAVLDRVRAVEEGFTHYIWRTAEDEDVRPEHKKLNGKKFRYDSPPFIPGEGNVHPGEIWNCRCYAEAVIPAGGFDSKPKPVRRKKSMAEKYAAKHKKALKKAFLPF